MSQQRECLIIETEPKKWFYVLETTNAPKNAWDWMEYAYAYGPFPTQERATDNLGQNFSNPGGWSVQEFDPTYELEEQLKTLISEATLPGRHAFGRYS